MTPNDSGTIFQEAKTRIEQALRTRLTVVVCGPGQPTIPDPNSSYHLREAVRRTLTNDTVYFFEELLETEQAKEIMEFWRNNLQKTPRPDELEFLILRGNLIEKDVHVVEGTGAITELTQFVDDGDIFRKVYAFVDESHRNDVSYIGGSVFARLLEARRLFWFRDEADLESKVRVALNPNRIAKSGILHGTRSESL